MTKLRANAYGKRAMATITIDPSSIEVVDSVGLPKVKFTITIEDNFIYHVTLSTKTYRRALAKIKELGPDNCYIRIVGVLVAHNKLDEAGFQITEKIKKAEEVPLIEETVVPIIITKEEVIPPVVTGRLKLTLKRKVE
jgi:hypothetical protein